MKYAFRLVVLLAMTTAIGSPVNADVVVPSGLNPGDDYHLMFATEGMTQGGSPNINFYNAFVMAEAALSPALTGTDEGVEWKAIASTPDVIAKDNALVSAPVYLMNSTLIANGFADLWDGELFAPVSINQYGDYVGDHNVWTGTFGFGDPVSGLELGGSSGTPVVGRTTSNTGGNWIAINTHSASNFRPMYALSEKLTVSNVPEPTAAWFLIGVLCLVMLASRRRRLHRMPHARISSY